MEHKPPAAHPELGILHQVPHLSQPPRVLLIEDEADIARFIQLELQAEGYQAEVARDGVVGLSRFRETRPHMVILDLGLPVMDGLEVARRIRKGSNTPILMLSARCGLQDIVDGLDTGADDFLPKPFSIEELLARTRALLRRVTPHITGELRLADLVVRSSERSVFRAGRRINLTAREFDLLELLVTHPGKIFTRHDIEEKIWPDYVGGSNVVDVYIGYLRTKLEEAGERRLIQTVRGTGYTVRDR